MNERLLRTWICVLAGTLLSMLITPADAQPFPSRPVTIVVPYPPGAATDLIARLVQPRLQAALGQPVIVENRPGANGAIGAAYVAKSVPDGYRILVAPQPVVAINPLVQKLQYDPMRDLAPLTSAANAVMAIAVHESLPVDDIKGLVTFAKKNPGKLAYGSSGTGSPMHIGGLLLAQRAGIDWTHVPYNGSGPMIMNLLSGEIKIAIATLSAFPRLGTDRRVRVIAIGEKQRVPGAPDVPTIAETFPEFEMTTWQAFYTTAGVPDEILKRLSAELVKIMRSDDVMKRLQELALFVNAEGPQHLARIQREDYERFERILREKRIAVQ